MNDDALRALLDDDGLSFWFKGALKSALDRDPVDAARDAKLLAVVLGKRAAELMAADAAQAAIRQASRD